MRKMSDLLDPQRVLPPFTPAGRPPHWPACRTSMALARSRKSAHSRIPFPRVGRLRCSHLPVVNEPRPGRATLRPPAIRRRRARAARVGRAVPFPQRGVRDDVSHELQLARSGIDGRDVEVVRRIAGPCLERHFHHIGRVSLRHGYDATGARLEARGVEPLSSKLSTQASTCLSGAYF